MEVLRDVAKDNDGDVSKSISIETLNLSEDLDPSLDLAGETVMEDLVSFLLGLFNSSVLKPLVRFSPIISTMGSEQTLSVVSTRSNVRSVDRGSKGAIPVLKYLLGEGI
ncbi:hypothetical protein AYI68_g7304 [Smittium mucronatum]|uniref:Uncharacterized protein n=1 Tax=Smittium mucronatum TaxID=133383 RepID=A0A1R0GP22_9FUNG|nr:hypothetical protein AYI68_g7304 [Smittium mucronatum]